MDGGSKVSEEQGAGMSTALELKYKTWRKTDNGKEVYDKSLSIALSLQSRGWSHYSIRAIIYVIRYNYDLTWGNYGGGFKIDNVFTPYLARELMATSRFKIGFFEIRRIKTQQFMEL